MGKRDKERKKKQPAAPHPAAPQPLESAILGNAPPSKAALHGLPVPPGEHTLENEWTLWYDKKERQAPFSALPSENMAQYEEGLSSIASFHTIEGFARAYTNVVRPAALTHEANYFCFRNRSMPEWENWPAGGCWSLKIPSKDLVDRKWEQLLIAAIGEAFEEPDVVGVEVSWRPKGHRVALWMGGNGGTTAKFRGAEKFRQVLDLDRTFPLEFKSFVHSLKDRSTYHAGEVFGKAER